MSNLSYPPKVLLTPEGLASAVDRVIAAGTDPELGHETEDQLHILLIQAFCPDWVVAEVERLLAADFPRWCA